MCDKWDHSRANRHYVGHLNERKYSYRNRITCTADDEGVRVQTCACEYARKIMHWVIAYELSATCNNCNCVILYGMHIAHVTISAFDLPEKYRKSDHQTGSIDFRNHSWYTSTRISIPIFRKFLFLSATYAHKGTKCGTQKPHSIDQISVQCCCDWAQITATSFDGMEMQRNECIICACTYARTNDVAISVSASLWLNHTLVPIDLNVCAKLNAAKFNLHTLLCIVRSFILNYYIAASSHMGAAANLYRIDDRTISFFIYTYFLMCPQTFYIALHAIFHFNIVSRSCNCKFDLCGWQKILLWIFFLQFFPSFSGDIVCQVFFCIFIRMI